jgi:hypothetical protein
MYNAKVNIKNKNDASEHPTPDHMVSRARCAGRFHPTQKEMCDTQANKKIAGASTPLLVTLIAQMPVQNTCRDKEAAGQ